MMTTNTTLATLGAYSLLLQVAPSLEEWQRTKSLRLASDICKLLCDELEIKEAE